MGITCLWMVYPVVQLQCKSHYHLHWAFNSTLASEIAWAKRRTARSTNKPAMVTPVDAAGSTYQTGKRALDTVMSA